MKRLRDLMAGVGPATVRGPLDVEITDVVQDSRRAGPGSVFCAIRGRESDGMAFAADAVKAGAVAVVSEDELPSGWNVAGIRVPNARQAAALLAREFYGRPDEQLKAVAVTGTNGKTTTAFIVAHLMRAMGLRCGLMGTVQVEIDRRIMPATMTTPDAVDVFRLLREMVDAGCAGVAMETSSHALHQSRVHGLEFDVAIFTNLTRDHLDYHGTMEDYFLAKEGLFTGLRAGEDAWAVVNDDDPYGVRILANLAVRARKIGYGAGSRDLVWQLLNVTDHGVRAQFAFYGQSATVDLPLFGKHNVANAAGALGAVVALGADFTASVGALHAVPAVPGRLERVADPAGRKIFVDYAHTDDALRKALQTVREIPHERVLVVFGCGGARDATKRPLMGAAAAELADLLYVTTDNPRTEPPMEIIDGIVTGIPADRAHATRVVADRRDAIREAIAEAGPHDIVLIAGKGHETYQEVQGVRTPFDDRQVARSAVEEACAR